MLHHSLDSSFYFEDSSIRVFTMKIQNDSIIQGGCKPSIRFGVLQYIEYISEF